MDRNLIGNVDGQSRHAVLYVASLDNLNLMRVHVNVAIAGAFDNVLDQVALLRVFPNRSEANFIPHEIVEFPGIEKARQVLQGGGDQCARYYPKQQSPQPYFSHSQSIARGSAAPDGT